MRSPLALIVEYHPWLRLILANLFGEGGFEVHSASNGAAALRLAARLRPELVVVGDRLPELSPEQLIAELETRAIWGTRVVRAGELMRQEAQQGDTTSQTTTSVGNNAVRALHAAHRPRPASRYQRHARTLSRQRIQIRRGRAAEAELVWRGFSNTDIGHRLVFSEPVVLGQHSTTHSLM